MLVHARGRRRIIPIVAPGGMIEMNYKIAVVRSYRVIEGKFTDAAPIVECSSLRDCRAEPGTLIGHLDDESQGTFRRQLAAVKNWAMTSSRKSMPAPAILGCSEATSSRIKSGLRVASLGGLPSSAI
jgi:hypothetical protein